MASRRCSGVRVLVEAGTGADGGVTLVTAFEAGGEMGVISELEKADVDAFPKCCFKRKIAPNTSNTDSNIAKTNFGLINIAQHNQKRAKPATMECFKVDPATAGEVTGESGFFMG